MIISDPKLNLLCYLKNQKHSSCCRLVILKNCKLKWQEITSATNTEDFQGAISSRTKKNYILLTGKKSHITANENENKTVTKGV